MEITSVYFLLFVGISLLIYWKLPAKYQWILLLADSLIFYVVSTHNIDTLAYLVVAVLLVYAATGCFQKYDGEEHKVLRKTVLIITMVFVAGTLVLLKYTNLFINTANFFRGLMNKEAFATVNWLAPLGISFYTLTLLSYLLDSYWKVAEYEKNPLKLLLYTSYFPLMISGPICIHREYAPELFSEHRFDYDRVTKAARRIAWGIVKKAVVADRLSVISDYMFSQPDIFTGIWVFFATFVYVIVLYFDFSGCMDIVLGVSSAFGITVSENFKAPFLSKTMQEFWQRWHITLGVWLKNYIMNPILMSKGFVNLSASFKKKFGKKAKKYPTYLAMLVLWFMMGLWHGNSWKYILGEGFWFWLVIVLEQILEPSCKKLKSSLHIKDENIFFKLFKIARTFVLYSFGMLFFRADSLASAFYMISRIPVHSGFVETLRTLYRGCFAECGGIKGFLAMALVFLITLRMDIWIYNNVSWDDKFKKLPNMVRWISYFAVSLLIITMGVFGKSSFIYFGF